MDLIVDHSETPPRKFVKSEFLGKGGFATCYKVVEVSPEKTEYACKIISKRDFFDPNKKQIADGRKAKLEREVKIQKNLIHENLVSLVYFFEDEKNIYLLLDYCPHKSLYELVVERGHLNEVEVRYFMKQMIEGVAYM